MTIDPFATANDQPANEAETTTTTTNQKETTMQVSNQGKIVTTIKHGAGYDAPWTVVHAENTAEAKGIMLDPEFKELLELTAKIAGAVAPKKSSGGGNQGGKPAAANQAPNGQTPPEGYVFKSGIGKTGKPWKAFMPIDRNSGLPVQWL